MKKNMAAIITFTDISPAPKPTFSSTDNLSACFLVVAEVIIVAAFYDFNSGAAAGQRAHRHRRSLHALLEMVVGGVPAQFVFELTDLSVIVNHDRFNARHFGKVDDLFGGHTLAVHAVVCTTGVNPGGAGDTQVRARLPQG